MTTAPEYPYTLPYPNDYLQFGQLHSFTGYFLISLSLAYPITSTFVSLIICVFPLAFGSGVGTGIYLKTGNLFIEGVGTGTALVIGTLSN